MAGVGSGQFQPGSLGMLGMPSFLFASTPPEASCSAGLKLCLPCHHLASPPPPPFFLLPLSFLKMFQSPLWETGDITQRGTDLAASKSQRPKSTPLLV